MKEEKRRYPIKISAKPSNKDNAMYLTTNQTKKKRRKPFWHQSGSPSLLQQIIGVTSYTS